MRQLKRYLPPLFTLLLIAFGASMPWLVSWGQDARISSLREKLELDAVSLTLQKDAGVESALEVVARESVSIGWEDDTQLTEQEALNAAVKAVQEMGRYDLLPSWETELLTAGSDGWAESVLVIAEDESTALVWNCYWESSPCLVTVDDASGKAVRFLVENAEELVEGEKRAFQAQAAQWDLFFQDYYGSELVEELSLNIYEYHTSFNY